MSDDHKPGRGKRSLKLIDDKSLMPEILPDPLQARARLAAGGPRDRVRKRLLQLNERAAAIAAAASLAACSESHGPGGMNEAGGGGVSGTGTSGSTSGGMGGVGGIGGNGGIGGTAGYGVVDPLPPPAGTGGFGGFAGTPIAGTGGTAGFGVVDPIPLPFVCPPSPADLIDVTSVTLVGTSVIIIDAQAHDPAGFLAESLIQVQTSAGVTATIEQSQTPFRVRVVADSNLFPPLFDVLLGFQCDGTQGVAHLQVGLAITPGVPGISQPSYELIDTTDLDGGI